MRLPRFIMGILLVGLLAVSCIREDLSDCLSTNYVVLTYKGDGTSEIFNDKISRVEMFIFDSENECVSSYVLPDSDVQQRKTQLPALPSGDYRIVCIGNTFSTEVRNLPVKSAPYDGILFADSRYYSGDRVSTNDSLYYASLVYDVPEFDTREEDQVRVIEFRCSHYDVIVEAVGIPDPAEYGGSLPTFEICGVLPCTDFENRACGEAVDYYPVSTYDGARTMLRTSLNIMRHTNHQDVNIVLRASGGIAATVNLAEFLASHPEVDVTKQEVLIPIRIEFKGGEVSINVPDWFIKEIKPGF